MNEAKRKNILFAVVAVVIAVVFFFAGFGTGFGVGKGAADAPDADAGAAEMDGGMQLSSDEDTDKGVSLTSVKLAREAYGDYDIMPIAETAYTVTATVSGDGLTEDQKGVTWSEAAFKNPSSTWATGKNVSDYVKTTPNGNQLTVQCLKAFGEQIIIKCSSSFNPNVSKDLKVDYMDRPTVGITRLEAQNLSASKAQFNFSNVVSASFHLSMKSTDHTLPYSGADNSWKIKVRVKENSPNTSSTSLFATLCKKTKLSFTELATHFPSYEISGSFNSSGFNVVSPLSVQSSFGSATIVLNNFFDSVAFNTFCIDSWGSNSNLKSSFLDGLYSCLNGEISSQFILYEFVFECNGHSEQVFANVMVLFTEFTSWYNSSKVTGVDFDAPYSNGVIFNQD